MSVNPHLKSSDVTFVSVSDMLKLVHNQGIAKVISGIADYIEQDFRQWATFDKSPRYAAHSPDGVIELMPTGNHNKFSFKYVNGHPKNTQIGLQTVTAFGVLSDVASGYPLMISEMTVLTALRTAATSALVAKYLAPKHATTLAMIGCGAQSEFQILAFQHMLKINKVRLYDIDPNAIEKCAHNLKGLGLDITLCESATDAIKGAEVITTCTADKKNATILDETMVSDGIHINAIGGDCPGKTELSASLLTSSDVFVEYEPQTRIEGDIQQLPTTSKVTEIYRVIRGELPGRTRADQRTIFDGVGFAVEDYAALRYIFDLLAKNKQQQKIELLANPQNPRDLFGLFGLSNSANTFAASQTATAE